MISERFAECVACRSSPNKRSNKLPCRTRVRTRIIVCQLQLYPRKSSDTTMEHNGSGSCSDFSHHAASFQPNASIHYELHITCNSFSAAPFHPVIKLPSIFPLLTSRTLSLSHIPAPVSDFQVHSFFSGSILLTIFALAERYVSETSFPLLLY